MNQFNIQLRIDPRTPNQRTHSFGRVVLQWPPERFRLIGDNYVVCEPNQIRTAAKRLLSALWLWNSRCRSPRSSGVPKRRRPFAGCVQRFLRKPSPESISTSARVADGEWVRTEFVKLTELIRYGISQGPRLRSLCAPESKPDWHYL
jgi:hypothetical protein